ncbi:MAG: CHAT domain-containing protein [Acidobacteriota bacterium]
MEYILDSPSGVVGFHHVSVAGPRVEASPEDFQRRLYRGLEELRKRSPDGKRLSRQEVESEVVGIGEDLFRSLFVGEIQHIYRGLPSSVETLLVTSNEPWIPWELLHDGDEFLCVRFRMGRWLAGQQRPVENRDIRHMLGLRAMVEGPEWDETSLLQGVESVSDDVSASIETNVTFQSLYQHLLESSFDLLHFSGHGEHDLESSLDAQILTADRPFRPRNVTKAVQDKLRRQRPFIFLNSCSVGRMAVSLTGLQGWARTWVDAGCAGFIAPSWSVSSASAKIFAEAFYGALVQGCDLGTAVHQARVVLRGQHPADLAWLAYVLYGTPSAQLLFGLSEKRGPQAADDVSADRPNLVFDPSPTTIETDDSLGRVRGLDRGQWPKLSSRRRLDPNQSIAEAPWIRHPRIITISLLLLCLSFFVSGLGIQMANLFSGIGSTEARGEYGDGTPSAAGGSTVATDELTVSRIGSVEFNEPEESESSNSETKSPPLTDSLITDSPQQPNDSRQSLLHTRDSPEVNSSGMQEKEPGSISPPQLSGSTQSTMVVPGRVAVLATSNVEPSISSAVRQAIQTLNAVEAVLVPGVHDPYQADLDASKTRGSEFYLFVSGTSSSKRGPVANISAVDLYLEATLFDSVTMERLARVSGNHTGSSGSENAALNQAAERCLEQIIDALRERT